MRKHFLARTLTLNFGVKKKMQNNITITQIQNKVLFSLGQTVITLGAKEALEESNQMPSAFLARHQSGDWGIV